MLLLGAFAQSLLAKESTVEVLSTEKKERVTPFTRCSFRAEKTAGALPVEKQSLIKPFKKLPFYVVLFLIAMVLINVALLVKLYWLKHSEMERMHFNDQKQKMMLRYVFIIYTRMFGGISINYVSLSVFKAWPRNHRTTGSRSCSIRKGFTTKKLENGMRLLNFLSYC